MQIQDAASASKIRTYQRLSGGMGDAPRPAHRPPEGRVRTDSVDFSTTTQELMRLQSMVAAQPEVRPDRIAALKAAIRNGTYRVDLEALAAKLLGE